ncbi:MAG: NUDIX domain-containing protein [Rhodospirillaceae bacterium]|nr:NUDIX domain-containing protein [Rhodospirillaceae bacterium]MDD9999997.1 NUDIX domain-containing protein [Rhodospirillaceae bacterium]
MKTAANVINVWAFRSRLLGSRFLLLGTSQLKANRYFNGGRFWQIPSGCVGDDEAVEDAVQRILGAYGLTASAIWAGEHAYIIYNRRFVQMQMITVFAAEVQEGPVRLDANEHSEFGWFSREECLARIHYKGLKEGLTSVHEYVTGTESLAKELCLYQRCTL